MKTKNNITTIVLGLGLAVLVLSDLYWISIVS
jgi:hypothetical protein